MQVFVDRNNNNKKDEQHLGAYWNNKNGKMPKSGSSNIHIEHSFSELYVPNLLAVEDAVENFKGVSSLQHPVFPQIS
jgi:hypothetical protein